MKFNFFIKVIPFLTTLSFIIFLSISNQKEYTKLRILIWNTPSLTLGKYLAISTGTGFLLSYFITNNLAKVNQSLTKSKLKTKVENNEEEDNEYIETSNQTTYDNILIERNINDPSPTINANFRVIGNTERTNSNYINNNFNNDIFSSDSYELNEQYKDQLNNNEDIKQESSISNDWDDQSYSSW